MPSPVAITNIGGASTDDVGNSGKGGDGSPGYVLIITYL